jgi:hypothetical protein
MNSARVPASSLISSSSAAFVLGSEFRAVHHCIFGGLTSLVVGCIHSQEGMGIHDRRSGVFAVSLVLGTIAIVDLRLLGFALTKRPFAELSRQVLPFTWAAFVIAVLAGSLLFISWATNYFVNAVLGIKMALIAVAGINNQVCTVVLPTDDGSCLHIRKAATPESDVQQIYRNLAIPPQVITPKHTWTQTAHSD